MSDLHGSIPEGDGPPITEQVIRGISRHINEEHQTDLLALAHGLLGWSWARTVRLEAMLGTSIGERVNARCGQFSLLMACDALRYVATCTCGAIHTQWDDWSLQTAPLEFRALRRVLERTSELQGDAPVFEREGGTLLALTLERSGKYRLWYGGCALELNSDDLGLLRDLLNAAAQRLNTEPRLHPQLAHALRWN
jgi:hypothetical protein